MEETRREAAKCFQDLIVWQKSHRLVLDVYQTTRSFPRGERFGLTSQLRRAIVSVPANIAEGFRKRSKPDKARFMNIAHASLDEARYYLILANDLSYCKSDDLLKKSEEVSRLIEAYAKCILNDAS
jgi:four helix bundle protein